VKKLKQVTQFGAFSDLRLPNLIIGGPNSSFKFQVSTLLLLQLVGIGGFRVTGLLFEGHLADICQPISDRIVLTVNVGLRNGNSGQLSLPIFLERQMNKHTVGFLTQSSVLSLIDSTPLNPPFFLTILPCT